MFQNVVSRASSSDSREFSMQHVRRPVVQPVRRPGMFTQETLTSRTGQTGTAGPNYVGNSFGTLSVYVVVSLRNLRKMVSNINGFWKIKSSSTFMSILDEGNAV